MKKCNVCKTLQPAENFYASQKGKTCKACRKAYQREWLAKHPGYEAARRAANPDYGRQWRAAHPGYSTQAKKRYFERHPEKRAADNERRRLKREAARRAAGIQPRPSVSAEERLARRRARDRLKWRSTDKPSARAQIALLLEIQGGQCAACRTDLVDAIHRDHIVPISRGGQPVMENLQLLCPPCNAKKAAKCAVQFLQDEGLPLFWSLDPDSPCLSHSLCS